ncbi:CO/xanthine dehydrogenase Mo-binding subunit [Bradyrhizobium sp. F1.13.4]
MSAPSPAPTLPVSLAANPKLSSWVKLIGDGRVAISPGKVEIGQGIVTALAQIAADELDIDIGRIEMIRTSTAASPNEGVTSGSLSVQQSGRALRQACAEVRQRFLAAASERLGVDASLLDIHDGTISGPGNVRTSYWELAGDVSLDHDAEAGATAKIVAKRTVAGHSVQRVDIPDKVFARPRFIHDCPLPDLLHGRVLRPDISGAKLIALDETAIRAVPGLVAIVRAGGFSGVVADSEAAAEAALKALRKGATWSAGEPLPDEADLAGFLKSQPVETTVIDTRTTATTIKKAARTLRRQYVRPYIAHASIAPSCAMAQWNGDRIHVWTHSQGVYLLRADLAIVLKLPAENIVVEHMEGAGCYGHNAADDVALDAVLLAKAAGGRPVRVQWSRHDEMAHAPFGAAMAIEIEADLDGDNEIVGWRHAIWSNGHAARPGRAAQPALLAATRDYEPLPAHGLDQSARGQWRRRRPQLRSALRPPGLDGHEPPAAGHAGADLGAADTWRTRQCLRHRVPARRDRRPPRRRPDRVPPATSARRARKGCDPGRGTTRAMETAKEVRHRSWRRLRPLQEHGGLLRRDCGDGGH